MHELRKSGSSEISVFTANEASDVQIAQTVKKLSVAFPDMKPQFFNLLAEQIAKSGFSSTRLDYALNTILNTFHYKQLTIADIMSIDVKCKVYSYTEMSCEVDKKGSAMSAYSPIWFGNAKKPHWVLTVDKERYMLPDRL